MEVVEINLRNKELDIKLLPLLLGKVFHVTSQINYEKIIKTKCIKSNKNGEFNTSFSQSQNSFGKFNGWISFVDLYSKNTEEAKYYAGDGYYFLQPKREWKTVVFLFISSKFWKDLKIQSKSFLPSKHYVSKEMIGEMTFVPNIECWYPGDIDLNKISKALIVNIY